MSPLPRYSPTLAASGRRKAVPIPGTKAPQGCVLLPEALRPCSQHHDQEAPCFLCSNVKTVLEDKNSLMQACFKSVFSLPSLEDMKGLIPFLYCKVCSG